MGHIGCMLTVHDLYIIHHVYIRRISGIHQPCIMSISAVYSLVQSLHTVHIRLHVVSIGQNNRFVATYFS